MKKILSVTALLLAVTLIALCCAACGEEQKSDNTDAAPTEKVFPLAGTYRFSDGSGISQQDIDDLRAKTSLIIREDNTGVLTYDTMSQTCVFDPEKKTATLQNGNTASYTFDGETLTIDMGDAGTQVYQKTP